MKTRTSVSLLVAAMALSGAMPALADDMTEGQAQTKMEGAGYSQVNRLHQVNGGEWMADAMKDGRPVMIVLYPDGKVSLREHVDVPPPEPAATAPAAPAKPNP